MILSLETQVQFFWWMVVLGGALGLAYDGLRILRSVVPHNGFLVQLEDGIFWLCAGFYSFWVILQNHSGEMRFFVMLGLFGGMVIYFNGLSHGVRWIGEGCLGVLQKIIFLILEILCTPFRLVYLLICMPLQRIGRFCDKKRKKCLYFCRNYAKIKLIGVGANGKTFVKRKLGFGEKPYEQKTKSTTNKKSKSTSKRKT